VLSARNISTDGIMMNAGTIHLAVKYMVAQEDQFLNWPPNPDWAFYLIQKSLPGFESIPNDTPTEFEFDLMSSQIPLYATDVYLYLVYSGAEGTFVGFKDISEPTPVDYFNSMDKICLYDETCPCDQIFAAGSPAAIEIVDSNGNGIPEWDVYPHDLENLYINFSTLDNPQSASAQNHDHMFPYVAAGDSARLFILSDNKFNHSMKGTLLALDPDDNFGHLPFGGTVFTNQSAIYNQVQLIPEGSPYYDPDQVLYGRYVPSTYSTFRGVLKWKGINGINSPYPQDAQCDYDD
jgi:hypothetical protein